MLGVFVAFVLFFAVVVVAAWTEEHNNLLVWDRTLRLCSTKLMLSILLLSVEKILNHSFAEMCTFQVFYSNVHECCMKKLPSLVCFIVL